MCVIHHTRPELHNVSFRMVEGGGIPQYTEDMLEQCQFKVIICLYNATIYVMESHVLACPMERCMHKDFRS